MEDDVRSKEFPTNYSSDATRVLDAMSFTKGRSVGLLGSMSIRSQQYAGDYDAFEIVNLKENSDEIALHSLAVRFKEIVKDVKALPKTYIGDIKAGSVEDWRVLPRNAVVKDGKLEGMDVVFSRRKLDELEKAKVISPNEAKYGHSLLKGKMTPIRFLEAKQKLKFHIVRWSVEDVLRGSKRLRDGRTFTLEEAFLSPSITKMDVISYVQNNRYTDFSMIYYFRNNGKLLNPDLYDFVDSIKENILYYEKKGNPFKVLKRKFALAKFERDATTIAKLTPILNSDLGRIYHVLGDIGTLIHLLEDEKPDPKTVRFEIDQFKNRLSNVYTLSDYLKEEHTILGEIESALKDPNRETLLTKLRKLEDRLQRILNENTRRMTKSKGLRGGVKVLDITETIPTSPNPEINKKRKAAAIATMNMLKGLAHFYQTRDPATSLGFRVIKDDIEKMLPVYDGKPEKETDEGHETAQRDTALIVLGKNPHYPFTQPSPQERFNREVKPMVDQLRAPNRTSDQRNPFRNLTVADSYPKDKKAREEALKNPAKRAYEFPLVSVPGGSDELNQAVWYLTNNPQHYIFPYPLIGAPFVNEAEREKMRRK